MKPLKSILVVFSAMLLAGLVSAGPGPSAAGRFTSGRRSPRSSDGNYQITVTGYYSGQGTGAITDATVSLSVPVKADNGTTTTLQAPNLTINGTYFSGTGTVGSATTTIEGRLDAARASRLTATFKTSDHHFGRIAGTLPSDPNTDNNWDMPHGPGPGQSSGGNGGSNGGANGGGNGAGSAGAGPGSH